MDERDQVPRHYSSIWLPDWHSTFVHSFREPGLKPAPFKSTHFIANYAGRTAGFADGNSEQDPELICDWPILPLSLLLIGSSQHCCKRKRITRRKQIERILSFHWRFADDYLSSAWRRKRREQSNDPKGRRSCQNQALRRSKENSGFQKPRLFITTKNRSSFINYRCLRHAFGRQSQQMLLRQSL